MAMPSPGLVIFDCDGVLVDSEPISLEVMLEVLAQAGCTLDPEEGYAHLLGKSLGSIGAWLRAEHGLDLTDAHLTALRARLFDRFRQSLKPISGVAEAIRAMPGKVCVASSSQPDRIRFSLGLTGLLDLFEPHIFSASMVDRGKPAPDLFLHAAQEMGVDPGDCVVIEDSPAGIEAAQAAGMQVIGFVGGGHAGPAGLVKRVANRAPSAIISSMEDLPALLGAGH
ncbi:HAD family hydrolase [Nioella nitratireducens]|uniref:HAD family hydrolase n=1 Tax=Nioella nitratireducens TaxID=1287720 RepID=UPI0008FD01C4|nr:HAD family hydrolase [Nioella nitratireducens]